MIIRTAQTIASTEAEGPGKRFALWVQGCSLRCPGCCNPEMFAERGGRDVEVADLIQEIVKTPGIEGISVLGGEPFEQAEAVVAVAKGVKAAGLSVMVYSGFTLAELTFKKVNAVDALLRETDLLVDGRFDQSQPEKKRRWIGSANQVMHFLTERYRPDDARFSSENTIEIRMNAGVITVNGWPAQSNALNFRRSR